MAEQKYLLQVAIWWVTRSRSSRRPSANGLAEQDAPDMPAFCMARASRGRSVQKYPAHHHGTLLNIPLLNARKSGVREEPSGYGLAVSRRWVAASVLRLNAG